MRLERVRTFLRWFYRYRSIQLTSEGTRFVLLTLAVGIAAINTGNNLLYLLLAMMLSLIIISGILSELCLKQLDLHRLMPAHIFANRPTTAALSIANRKPRFPSFSLRVMDVIEGARVDRGIHLVHLPPKASVIQSYPLLVTRRGRYRIEGVKLLTRFPFGLFIKAATVRLPSELVVYPEVRPLPDALVRDLTARGHEQTIPRRGPGVELFHLRRYKPGDDSRTIHWKTTARQARLMVKETEAEDQRRVTMALPTAMPGGREAASDSPGAPQQSFERAVVLMASLATFFYERGFSLRALIGEQETGSGSGPGHLHEILRRLGLCQPVMGSGFLTHGVRTLGERTAAGELTILVLPWPDAALRNVCRGISRVMETSELP